MMDREQILNVVVKNIKLNVDGLEDQEIDPAKSMAEYGAESLDIVEIVAASMRELRIKVPRTALATLKNINELVDLFFTVEKGTAEVSAHQ
jgi:acyl carrier protein